MRLYYFAALLFALFITFSIQACNTTKGIGQDLEAAGEAIEEKAKAEGAEN